MELDQVLVSRALRGDRLAFQALTEQCWKIIYIFIQQRVRDRETVQDLAQETFLSAYGKRESLKNGESFLSWLLAIAANKVIDERRRRKPCQQFEDENAPAVLAGAAYTQREPAPERAIEEREESERIERALGCMDDLYRTVLILRYWSGLTPAQIARLLEEPEGTIRNRIFRAHMKLRSLLEEEPSPVGDPRQSENDET